MKCFLANTLLFGNQILSVAYKLPTGLGKKKRFLTDEQEILSKVFGD